MSDDSEAARHRPRRLGFLVGLLLALVVGVAGGYALRAATEPPPPAPPPPPSTQAQPTQPQPVSAPCVAVADHAGELTAQLQRAVHAIAALDPAALRTVVDEVERLHTQLQPAAQACRAAAGG